ncbi:MAG: DUF2785 domain-containing protein [Proteobacteria bacterium]|nr:DUF2785 domain-containing protein [Pseudomonadota bacterium]
MRLYAPTLRCRRTRALRLGLIALATLLAAAPAGAESHDRAYWYALAARHYALPAGADAEPLVDEVVGFLGATDPALRDGIAYEALATWVYQDMRLAPPALERLRARLEADARQGLGEPEGDGTFRRSFSVLALSVLAAANLKHPWLDDRGVESLVAVGCDALAGERDLRGYVPGKGWAHATAHAADLLKYVGRAPNLSAVQQATIIRCIATRLRTAGQVFVYGEDQRLAAALASVLRRPDAAVQPLREWCESLAREHQTFWDGPFSVGGYVALRTQLNALAELQAELEGEEQPAGVAAAREALRRLRRATR